VLCLLRSPLRWAGAGLAAAACIAALTAVQPDVLISATGEVVALRGHDGRLTVLKSGNNDALAVGDWLNADGDTRPAKDRTLAQGFACDPDGCAGRLADGAIVAVARNPAALADDCGRAALVVTPRPPPPGCAAMVVDRWALRATGALALFHRDRNFDVVATRPSGLDRPWALRARRNPAGVRFGRTAAAGRDTAAGGRCGGVTSSPAQGNRHAGTPAPATSDGTETMGAPIDHQCGVRSGR
jgi:competence protein ComEC